MDKQEIVEKMEMGKFLELVDYFQDFESSKISN